MKKKLFRFVLFFSFLGVFSFVALETFARFVLIPRDFKYISVRPNQFPYFSLVQSYRGQGITIRNGRREYFARESRSAKVGFVGDSIAFCATESDFNCFVELIQKNQKKFDAYNFGVPGYGLLDIEAVLNREVQQGQYRAMVYFLNFNDVFSAQPVMLSLLSNSHNRFASVHDYGGFEEKLRGFIKDHIKILPVGKYMWGIYGTKVKNLFSIAKAEKAVEPTKQVPSKKAAPEPTPSCYEDSVRELRETGVAYFYKRVYPAWQKLYRDEKLMKRYAEVFVRMKKTAEKHGARLLVVPFHDLIFFVNQDRGLNDILLKLLKEHDIDHIDTWPMMAANRHKCGFYSDPGHPAWFGNKIFAEAIQKRLIENYLPGASVLAGRS